MYAEMVRTTPEIDDIFHLCGLLNWRKGELVAQRELPNTMLQFCEQIQIAH
jgi:hypothetical protein